MIELPNRSHRPQDEYELHGSDVIIALEDWLWEVEPRVRDQMIIWHTHPSGNVGPSRGDLDHKLDYLSYLVVSIDPETREYQTTLF